MGTKSHTEGTHERAAHKGFCVEDQHGLRCDVQSHTPKVGQRNKIFRKEREHISWTHGT